MTDKSDIELATTEDLVTELQKRMNFRGVVIWQPGYNGDPSTEWRWHAMHCKAEAVCREIVQALTPVPDLNITIADPGTATEPGTELPPAVSDQPLS